MVKVLIVGWYGTETAGDKAILWGVVKWVRAKYGDPKIYVSSLHPFVTNRTLIELGLLNIEIVKTYSGPFCAACTACSAVVLGGGPLMDIEQLDHILYAFIKARQRQQQRIILGCGLGPIKSKRYQDAVYSILTLASQVFLRDRASVTMAYELAGVYAEVVDDPAIIFIQNAKEKLKIGSSHKKKRASFFLRFIPDQYLGASGLEADKVRHSVDRAILEYMRYLIDSGWEIRLLPMHTFVVGDDDRVYSRRLARQINGSVSRNTNIEEDAIYVSPVTLSPNEIVAEMICSDIVIAMRYHSVVFAFELARIFVAIDYTSGGKIQGYLSDRGESNRIITLARMSQCGKSALVDVVGPKRA